MEPCHNERLTDDELLALFDELFPHGLAGADVLSEIAPEGWERSSLLACFHPLVEGLLEEQRQLHRNIESFGRVLKGRDELMEADERLLPELTIEDVRREYRPEAIEQGEEMTELVALCLWDVFSDNHDVVTVDGRVADIGSFRGASAFLDEY